MRRRRRHNVFIPFLRALGFVHEKKKEGAIFFRVSREALRKPCATHEKKMRP